MKLKRKWARVCLCLMIGAIVMACIPWIAYSRMGAQSNLWAYVGVGGTLACLFAYLIVQWSRLRCPHCGNAFAPPRWKSGTQYYCPRCGKPFVFDDDPEVGVKETERK